MASWLLMLMLSTLQLPFVSRPLLTGYDYYDYHNSQRQRSINFQSHYGVYRLASVPDPLCSLEGIRRLLTDTNFLSDDKICTFQWQIVTKSYVNLSRNRECNRSDAEIVYNFPHRFSYSSRWLKMLLKTTKLHQKRHKNNFRKSEVNFFKYTKSLGLKRTNLLLLLHKRLSNSSEYLIFNLHPPSLFS